MISSLLVVSPITNHTQFAGIAHPRAIRGIRGPAIFAFRQIHPAIHLAQAIDHRMLYKTINTFTEELIEPYANLTVGQNVCIHYDFNQHESLKKVVICSVPEDIMKNYAQATHISIAVIEQQKDELIISDIISPPRDISHTVNYLCYVYEK